MAKENGILGAQTLAYVPIGAIQEQDPFTARFLATQQFETDTTFDIESWDTAVIETLAPRLLPILVQRQGGYQYLGSGQFLRLLQQIYEPHQQVRAIVLEARRVSTKLKLDVLAGDLLFLPTLFRTRWFLPRRIMQLLEAIVEAGGSPIQGTGVHAFSRASGYSYNSLKPQRAHKTNGPQAEARTQTTESSFVEGCA